MGKATQVLEDILADPRARKFPDYVRQTSREIAMDLDRPKRGRGRPPGSSIHMERDYKLLIQAALRYDLGNWAADEAFEVALSKATPSNSARATRVRVRGRLYELDSTLDPVGGGRLTREYFVRFAAELGINIPGNIPASD